MNTSIKQALISEKSFTGAASGKYSFVFDCGATKDEIAKIITESFGVTVLSVKTMNYSGKLKQSRKGKGKRNNWKKAILTLKSGQKIDLFEIEEEKGQKASKAQDKQRTGKPANKQASPSTSLGVNK